MIKTRVFPESNYKGIYFNGKTLRFALDGDKPIQPLEYAEFFDIGINNKCLANCEYCYVDAKNTGTNFENIIAKAQAFFGSMTENQKPFQCAIGASGEPTMHPQFVNFLETLHNLGITPNYTTNGMFIHDREKLRGKHIFDILSATKKYCGGVAFSCHPHLKYYWETAANLFYENKIMINFHNIISDKKSIDDFKEIYECWKDKVDYFVLLPYGNVGRAPHKEIDWDYLVSVIPENNSNIAFGANFYSYLKSYKGNKIKASLYEPHIFSKYISFEDVEPKIYPSSFEVN